MWGSPWLLDWSSPVEMMQFQPAIGAIQASHASFDVPVMGLNFCCQIRIGPYTGWTMDVNFWGEICVPIGLLLGFAPVLWVAAFGRCEGINVDKRGKGPGA